MLGYLLKFLIIRTTSWTCYLEKRIINIEIATRTEWWVRSEEAFLGNPWAAEWKSGGRDSTFSPAPDQNYDPKLECVGGQQGCGMDLRRPHLVSNGSYRLEGNAGPRLHFCRIFSANGEYTPIHVEDVSWMNRWNKIDSSIRLIFFFFTSRLTP